MSSEELNELQEHAEHAKHDPTMAPVSLTMAIVAVLVATVSLLGHRAHTEEVVLQNQVSDQWAHYQAKSIRRHSDEQLTDLASMIAAKDAAAAERVGEKYKAEADRYKDDLEELQAKARELELETQNTRRRADRFDLGEVFLEIGLVVTSITLLSGRKIFWQGGIVMALLGIVVAVTGALIH